MVLCLTLNAVVFSENTTTFKPVVFINLFLLKGCAVSPYMTKPNAPIANQLYLSMRLRGSYLFSSSSSTPPPRVKTVCRRCSSSAHTHTRTNGTAFRAVTVAKCDALNKKRLAREQRPHFPIVQ